MPGVVRGLPELRRAFAVADQRFLKDKKTLLRHLGEPVKRDAEVLALTNISHMSASSPWAQMRTGATETLSYVAPIPRGTKILSRKRRRFARLLLSRSMEPAIATGS